MKKMIMVLTFILIAFPVFMASSTLLAASNIIKEEADATINESGDALHPIEVEISKLLDKDPSTNGQVQAFAKGFDLWDAELNKVYKELMTAYGKNEALKKSLKEAQLAWIKFRDAEFEHLRNAFLTKDGSMYRIFLASDRMNVVKERALELQNRLDAFTDSN